MSDTADDRLARVEAGQTDMKASQAEMKASMADMKATQAEMKVSMTDMKATQADIKATLARLEPMIVRVIEGQAASNERLARLEGRIEEQSSMLQLVVAGRMGRKPAA